MGIQNLARLAVPVPVFSTITFGERQMLCRPGKQGRAMGRIVDRVFQILCSEFENEVCLEQHARTVHAVEIGAKKFLVQGIETGKTDDQQQPATNGCRIDE